MKIKKTKIISIVRWDFTRSISINKNLCIKCIHKMTDGCPFEELTDDQKKLLTAVKCKWFEI